MNRSIVWFPLLLVLLAAFAGEVVASTSLAYQYDANGNMISGDGKNFEYNDANRLIRVRHGDATGPVIAEYFYDHNGQRIKKVEGGVITYYIGKHFDTRVSPTGVSNTSYYFANGERVAKKDSSGKFNYYHSDHLGSTNVMTDASGNLVERTLYYPFGEIREGGNDKYTYTGKENDKRTYSYYYESRYYNNGIKHFLQSDNFSPNLYDPQALNRYAYAKNNSIKLVDPSGHSSILSISIKHIIHGMHFAIENKIIKVPKSQNTFSLEIKHDYVSSYPYNKSGLKYQNYKVGSDGGQCVPYAKNTTNVETLTERGQLGTTWDEKVENYNYARNNKKAFAPGESDIEPGNVLLLKEGDVGHVATVVDIDKDSGDLIISESNYDLHEHVSTRRISSNDARIYGIYDSQLE
jgi:RHS repeat-associated protein